MKNQQKQTLAKHNNDLPSTMLTKVRDKIITIKGQNVISDADVADLYGVETKRINEAVRNNPDKFPPDYMFTLTKDEHHDLRSKISTTKISSKSRTLPKVFTEKRVIHACNHTKKQTGT